MPFRRHCKPEKFAKALAMRKAPTPAERVLWSEFLNRPYGLKFRRQVVILGWIADFYCAAKKLVIEVDGAYHAQPRQAAADARRDRIMREHGLEVIRFSNNEVHGNVDAVLQKIWLSRRGTYPKMPVRKRRCA